MQLQRQNTTLAFPTPIVTYQLDPCDALNHQLVADIAALRAQTGGLTRSNVQGWHSENDLFRRPEASFVDLCKAIRSATMDLTKAMLPQYSRERYQANYEGWINVNGPGGMNKPHKHPGAFWSGCYYVQVPESAKDRSGQLEFHDPRARDGVNVAGSTVFGNELRYEPRPGLLVLFPSYTLHWVYPNLEDEERISIAFNVAFRPIAKRAPEQPGAS